MKLSDHVIARVAQIIQESMLTMTDCTDAMRMIDVEPSATEPDTLVLTAAYKQRVKESHEKMIAEALGKKAAREAKK